MGVTKILVLAAFCATAAHAGSAGEGEHAARLEMRVETALERILGPDRAAATIEVLGERVSKRQQSEITGAAGREAPAAETAIMDLPGYTKSAPKPAPRPKAGTIVHSSNDETVTEASFTVRRLRAWLVLDKNLKDSAAAEAVRVTGEILALDQKRGDELTVVRTAFIPAWRAAFSRPRDAKHLALFVLGAAALLGASALLGGAVTRSARALADGFGRPRHASALGEAHPIRRIFPLPPLDKGGRG